MPEKSPENDLKKEDNRKSMDFNEMLASIKNTDCAWIGMVVVCAAYNLGKTDTPPDPVPCLRRTCDAIITTMPRIGCETLLEPGIDEGDPSCHQSSTEQHRFRRARAVEVEIQSKTQPSSPAAESAKPVVIPPPEDKPPEPSTPDTTHLKGPWVNPFPRKSR